MIVNNRSIESANRLNDFEKMKINQFKKENPTHRYSRGKKSPHYGREMQRRQKINTRARINAENQKNSLKQRYQNQIQSKVKKNFSRANYGFLAFFAVSEIISQHLSKSLQNSLQNENHPEYQAQASTRVFATTL